MNGIIDTSVLVDLGQEDLPDRSGAYGISVLSIAELHTGVLRARGHRVRAERVARLTLAEKMFDPLPIDRAIAVKYAELATRTQRLDRRPHVVDGLIAATAIVLGVPVITRDDYFDRIPGVEVVKV